MKKTVSMVWHCTTLLIRTLISMLPQFLTAQFDCLAGKGKNRKAILAVY